MFVWRLQLMRIKNEDEACRKLRGKLDFYTQFGPIEYLKVTPQAPHITTTFAFLRYADRSCHEQAVQFFNHLFSEPEVNHRGKKLKFEINKNPTPEQVLSKTSSEILIENLQMRVRSLEIEQQDLYSERSTLKGSIEELKITVTGLKAQISENDRRIVSLVTNNENELAQIERRRQINTSRLEDKMDEMEKYFLKKFTNL